MKYFIFLLLILTINFSQSQVDSIISIYKNMEVKKYYSVSLHVDSANGKKTYKANDKIIDKKTYDKFKETRKNPEVCKPCMLETYDANGILKSKAVKYLDCPVGVWIVYYPTGKIREIGHYRENDTDIWDPLWDNGYCMKHGPWVFYDEDGKVTKVEKYNFGSLKD